MQYHWALGTECEQGVKSNTCIHNMLFLCPGGGRGGTDDVARAFKSTNELMLHIQVNRFDTIDKIY